MTRLDKWKDEKRIGLFIRADNEADPVNQLHAERVKQRETKVTVTTFVRSAREIIFEVRDGQPIFHFLIPILDPETFELVISPNFEMFGFESDDEVKELLAWALVEEVPVYPNEDSSEKELTRIHQELLTNGLQVEDSEGRRATYKLTRYADITSESADVFDRTSSFDFLTPAELAIAKQAVRREMKAREEAGRLLTSLRASIAELKALLKDEQRNEDELQDCLTRNPVLFGTEYRAVLPKHRLGDDFIMDYALERVSGLVDLMEIEASTHRVFNRNGDPTAALVHAERQVLDWLDLIERTPEYFRRNLPGLHGPIGYVVIGRSSTLTSVELRRLERRNRAFYPSLQIMTYDEVLDRAESLLRVLEGSRQS